jgi:hypothetical protein
MSMTWEELEHLRPAGEWRLPLPPTCKRCAYNLTGLTEERCPECGTPFTWREVRQRAGRVWAMTLRLRHANQDATTGLIIALSGWFALGFAKLIGNGFLIGITAIMAIIAAVTGVVLGSQVLNVRRVPSWAREFVCKPPPSIPLGAATMFLAMTLLFGVLIFGLS